MVQLTHNNLTHIYIGDIMNDDEFYLITTKEVEDGEINQALWAKLINKNKGDADKTKYDYIDEVVKRKVKDEDERLRLESEKRISELAESKRIADEKARGEEKAKADLAETMAMVAESKRIAEEESKEEEDAREEDNEKRRKKSREKAREKAKDKLKKETQKKYDNSLRGRFVNTAFYTVNTIYILLIVFIIYALIFIDR